MKKLLIAGANGFLGRCIAGHFSGLGWQVAGLARRPEGLHARCRYVNWDGKKLGNWTEELDGCDVLVNMVGSSINCRHTEENRRRILESRVASTSLLGCAVAGCKRPPELWINGSATGIYRESYEEALGESGAYGSGFIAEVVERWEDAFFSAGVPDSVRRVALRTSMVLADEPGNPFRILSRLAKLGLGGKAGGGRQMVSWVHVDDAPRVVEFIVTHAQLSGPVNMAAPGALTQAEMMSRFRKHVGMPVGIPAPALGVRLGAWIMGTAPELILNSSHVVADKLLENGFLFKNPELRPAEWQGDPQ